MPMIWESWQTDGSHRWVRVEMATGAFKDGTEGWLKSQGVDLSAGRKDDEWTQHLMSVFRKGVPAELLASYTLYVMSDLGHIASIASTASLSRNWMEIVAWSPTWLDDRKALAASRGYKYMY